MKENFVSADLSAEAADNIMKAITAIRASLPFLVPLTPEQRRRLQHASASGQGYLQDTITFVQQNPDAMPGNFNTPEFLKDGALLGAYAPIAAALARLNEDVNDTFIALQADLYAGFLDVYAFAKANNRSGAYDAYVTATKARFAKSPRKSKDSGTTTNPPTA